MRSVAELSAEANNYNFSGSVSFRRWTHVLKTIKSRADHYASHADYEDAYILYLRWADLILNKLPTHPEFGHKKLKYEGLMKQLSSVIKHAEAVKARLEERERGQRSEHSERSNNQYEPQRQPVYHDHHYSHQPSVDYDLSSVDTSTLDLLRNRDRAHAQPTQAQRVHQPVEPPIYSPRVPPPLPPSASSAPKTHPVLAKTEGGAPLRTLFIPESLQAKFLAIAEPNTRKKLETCGILCGRLNRNALFVTDLVIPHQINTENSCSTTSEEELFDYVESKDLIMVGWIHTHPTQSCFMSSVDLHTHNSYQLMLPEAVALVCAPTKTPGFGAFRLTDPTGVDTIKHCSRPGFHPHDERNLYCAALPGHVRLHSYEFTARDLR